MQSQNRILVPVDGSVEADKAVAFAAELARAYDAVLDLRYVSYFDAGTDDVVEQFSWLPDSVTGSSRKAAVEILAHACGQVPAMLQVEKHQETGIPAKKIVEFAERHGHRMIVLGGRGLGVVEGFLLGSVSQEVMESAKCSVVIVH